MSRTLFAVLLGLAGATAAARDLHDEVLQQLAGIEDTPSAEGLRALGPSVATELLAIAQDTGERRTTRARAVHALGWFPTDETQAFLLRALGGDDELLRRKAVYALGNGWGDAALPHLERALTDEDIQLRIAAANALGALGTDAARAALDRRLAVEAVPAVTKSIQKALGR